MDDVAPPNKYKYEFPTTPIQKLREKKNKKKTKHFNEFIFARFDRDK